MAIIGPVNERLVAFVLFAHARALWTKIYQKISEQSRWRIVHVQEHTFDSAKELIAALYSHDYAPLSHLRGKTRYLESVGLETLVVFAQQSSYELVVAGKGKWAHHEEKYTRDLKSSIREEWNPRDSSGAMTHNHVIHATDSQLQAEALERHIGGGLHGNSWMLHGPVRILPRHIQSSNLRLRSVRLSDLRIRILPDMSLRRVEETPHFRALQNRDSELYWRYVSPHIGTRLRDGHSWHRFTALERLARSGRRLDPIVAASSQPDHYVVLDGAHRAAVLHSLGATFCVVAVHNDENAGAADD